MSTSRRPWASHVDMYRKVPSDLMEGSRRGSVLSYISIGIMVVLFIYETSAYFTSRMVKDLALDKSEDPRIRLNFNITMMDLRCDWAVIDVVSVLGNEQNVTAHVTKWNMDQNGIRKGYRGRNRNQQDISLYDETVTETLEELHENGEDAISLNAESLAYYQKEHDYVFVDFFAGWCSHCRDLAPTWEALAEVMVDAGKHLKEHAEDYSDADFEAAERVEMPVVIGKVDCVANEKLCTEQVIRAYPTLRLFVDGDPWQGGDYRGHRTILEMVEYLYYVEEQHKELLSDESGERGEKARSLHVAHEGARTRLDDDTKTKETQKWHDQAMAEKRRLFHEWKDEEHPGCQLQGHLLLDRVPGNFHILARSTQHDLVPHMTNVSHQVNQLTIGDPAAKLRIDSGKATVPSDVDAKIAPLDGNVYTTEKLHEAYHHYLKIVPTKVEGLVVGRRQLRVYQILPNSQLTYYKEDMVPEAKFTYDLSPISVTYRKEKRRWYEYCTSIMAIIGGVFTVIGMVESSIQSSIKAARRSMRKSGMSR